MDINRKDFLRGATIVALLSSVSEIGASTAGASTFVTSKLARSYNTSIPNTIVQAFPYRILSSSVLTSGENSTLVISFDRNITFDTLKNAKKSIRVDELSVTLDTLTNSKTNSHNFILFDLLRGNYGYSIDNYNFKTVNTNIRYSGNTLSLDFPSKVLNVGASTEFASTLNYQIINSNNSIEIERFYSAAKTNNFIEAQDPIRGE